MTKKGKKKKQKTAASTSKETLQKQTSQEQTSQEQTSQEQTSQEQSSQQQKEQSSKALPSLTQQKTTIGKEQEAAASTSKQTSDGSSKQQKKQISQGQQQQESLGSRQVSQDQPQQQQLQQQQQGAWGRPRQQIPQSQQPQGTSSQLQQRPQGAWSQPQQRPQGARSQPQQQQSQGAWGQQQPQGARSQPQQQQSQRTWSQPQQQEAWGQAQQPQGAWSRPQQLQRAWSQPQQQPQGAWGQAQQHPQGTLNQPQQPQGAWGQQQPQRAWSQSQQQQPQETQSQLQQQQSQGTQSQLQQQQSQTAWEQQQHRATLPQQQQKASIDTGAAGDGRQAIGDVHRQQPSSTTSLQMTKLSLTDDPFHKEKTTKAKMSSEQLKVYHDMIPKRKNPLCGGKIGKNIFVFTNMFQIIFSDKFVTNAIHYDIVIRPFNEKPSKTETEKETKLPKKLCRDIFEQCRNKHFSERFPAYDGNKNAYSANELPFSDYMQDVFWHLNDKEQKKQYEITLNKVAYIDLSWIKNFKPGLAENRVQTALQVLDIIIRHGPESRFINVGRSLYWDIDMKKESLGDGLSLSTGGFLSGILGWKPYLNVDVAHKGFTTNLRVLQYIAKVTKINEQSLSYNTVMQHRNKILSFLKGLKVTYAIPNSPISKRTFRVLDLWCDSCDSHTFTSSDVIYTITKYFRDIKRYNIKRTDLPTLHVGKTSDGGKILVPLELCTIVGGQAFNKKLDETQTRNMIKETATAAPTRKQNIEITFKKLEINDSSVMEKEFNLSVSTKMQMVDARVLPPPGLKYANSTITVERGVWRLQRFNQAKSLGPNSWSILTLINETIKEPPDSDLQTFIDILKSNARIVGMTIGKPITQNGKKINTNDLRSITNYFNEYKHLQLIIVVIPDNTDVIYGNVKKITEMDIGVLTQCIKYKTVKSCINPKTSVTTTKNLLQKINSKLNGVNHILDKMPSCLSNYSCMLVGADVTHPAPDSKSVAPSIAAVAASRNNSAFQYNVTLRLQPPTEEMILDLEAIILSQLNIYYQETKSPPRRLIYYRDGVSEGQLPQIMFYEINAIKNAIKKFNKGNIEITCMVVQKRHHVRLFPANEQETDDKNCNVRAGTIVDTTITHPDHIDFYLVSHASIQGTARPTRYRCICNDSKFNEDQLEEMTYFLCHMYARCTRSVSYPAPTYYAHLAAFRGRALLQGNPNFNLADLEREQRNFKIKMEASPMYFV
ncbi:PREDICTED: protein argonaute-2-like [Acromyrmex echinatior]|nr:PREDICTED: protein argonaute-2-like [Acromyrmex echinatior]